MALAGSPERFAALCDRFFGYTDAADTSGRFEGFNNETDMEAPYAYFYAGRHDRLCEVIDAGLTYMFTTGRGGILVLSVERRRRVSGQRAGSDARRHAAL